MFNVYFEETFDLLIAKTLELQRALTSYKGKHGENETYKFYESVMKVMKLSWNTFLDFKSQYEHVEMIKSENELLRERCRYLSQELEKYRVVEHLKLSGELDQICEHIDQIIFKKELAEKLAKERLKKAQE